MEQDNAIHLRLNELIEHLHKSQIEFSKDTKIAPGNLSQILKGKRPCGSGVVNKIKIAYPEVNTKWLKEGEGDMFVERPFAAHTEAATSNLSERLKESYPIGRQSPIHAFAHQISEETVSSLLANNKEVAHTGLSDALAECKKVTDEAQKTLKQMQEIMSQATTMLKTANTIMTNAIQLNSDMKIDHRDTKALYDDMHQIQQDHIAKGQEWIDEGKAWIVEQKDSIRSMRTCLDGMREYIKEQIDEQTKETENTLAIKIDEVLAEYRKCYPAGTDAETNCLPYVSPEPTQNNRK